MQIMTIWNGSYFDIMLEILLAYNVFNYLNCLV